MKRESTPRSRRRVNRQDILQEACALGEHGWQNLSMRALSKRIDYSTIKLYQEFGSKEGILYELQQLSLLRLKQRLANGMPDGEASPRERLVAASMVLWNFAQEERTLFNVLFGGEGVVCQGRLGENIQLATDYLWSMFEPAIPRTQPQRMLHWWALTYGFISISRYKNGTGYNVEQSYLDALNSLPVG